MKRVEVEWTDSCSIELGWDDLSAYQDKQETDLVRSCGFLIAEKDDSVMLALSWTPKAENPKREADSVNHAMVIPRAAIREVKELRTK